MTESVNVTSAVLGKKMESYKFEAEDYVAENELTITITLAEYRKLIASHATKLHDIAKANEDKYTRESENKMLKEEVDALRARIYELQNGCTRGMEVNHA